MVTLWDHQREHVDRVKAALMRKRRVVMCAPPGTGKTRMSKFMLASKMSGDVRDGYSGRALFCVHRRGLVENASDSFNEAPTLDHGLIMSGNETAFGKRFQVASIDTLNSWWVKEDGYHGSDVDRPAHWPTADAPRNSVSTKPSSSRLW